MKKCDMVELPYATQLSIFEHKWDLHCHTTFGDGQHSVKQMIEAAEEKGFEILALTEHVRTSAMKWWKNYVEQITKHRQSKNVQVLIGMEANAIGLVGNVDVPDEMWNDAEIVLGAIHGYYDDDTWDKLEPTKLSSSEALNYEIQKALGLCENLKVDIIAHPFWLYQKYFDKPPEAALRLVFNKAKETNTAVEINYQYVKNPQLFKKLLLKIDPLVSFGSNAHSIMEIKNVLTLFKEIDL